jgi:hypothetical protein
VRDLTATVPDFDGKAPSLDITSVIETRPGGARVEAARKALKKAVESQQEELRSDTWTADRKDLGADSDIGGDAYPEGEPAARKALKKTLESMGEELVLDFQKDEDIGGDTDIDRVPPEREKLLEYSEDLREDEEIGGALEGATDYGDAYEVDLPRAAGAAEKPSQRVETGKRGAKPWLDSLAPLEDDFKIRRRAAKALETSVDARVVGRLPAKPSPKPAGAKGKMTAAGLASIYITSANLMEGVNERVRQLVREKRYDEAQEVLKATEKDLQAAHARVKKDRQATRARVTFKGGGVTGTSTIIANGGTIMLGGLKAKAPRATGAWEDLSLGIQGLKAERGRLEKLKKAPRDVELDVRAIVRGGEDARGKDLARFLGANYAWSLQGARRRSAAVLEGYRTNGGWGYSIRPSAEDGRVSFTDGNVVVKGGGELTRSRANELIEKLRRNLGQKVLVESRNVAIAQREVGGLGISWTKGNNDVVFAVIDEGQFRALLELEGRSGRKTPMVLNKQGQETIVGTDALLANDMRLNVARAAGVYNKFRYLDNPVDISHEKYLLISNDGYLTAVKAGEMHHWTEPIRPVQVVEVPQTIEVPRVGRLVKFEKTLIRPEDMLIIEAQYEWKGDR